jgi:hypothetical protein
VQLRRLAAPARRSLKITQRRIASDKVEKQLLARNPHVEDVRRLTVDLRINVIDEMFFRPPKRFLNVRDVDQVDGQLRPPSIAITAG